MIAKILSSVLFLLVATVQAQLPIKEPVYQINGTELTDRVIENVRAQIIKDHLDVIHTPDVNITFGNKSIALYNGTVIGLANFYRVGDVLVNVTLRDTKVRSAFAFYNVSTDQYISIKSKKKNYPNGHIHMDVDNVTVYTVFKFDYTTQDLTLDEFELSVGNFNYNVTGLGSKAQNDSAMITKIVKETKGPVLKVFNITFKLLVNAALKAVKNALLSAG